MNNNVFNNSKNKSLIILTLKMAMIESARLWNWRIWGRYFFTIHKCTFRRASIHVTVPEVKAVSHWRLVSSVPACLPFLPGNNETQRGRVCAYVREPTMACKCSLFMTSFFVVPSVPFAIHHLLERSQPVEPPPILRSWVKLAPF